MRIIKDRKRRIAAGRSIGKKYKYTVKAPKSAKRRKIIKAETDLEVNERIIREEFSEQLIHELEKEYSLKVSVDTWGKIMDLADDLNFGAGAHKHGSTPLHYLEGAIYDIIEEDMGIVIGSTNITTPTDIIKSSSVKAGIYTKRPPINRMKPVTDMEYIQKLADGVLKELNKYYGDSADCAAEVSDAAITFTTDDFIYIQPLDGIVADDADLNDDITELFETVVTDWTPRF